jgi:hypothetical protein
MLTSAWNTLPTDHNSRMLILSVVASYSDYLSGGKILGRNRPGFPHQSDIIWQLCYTNGAPSDVVHRYFADIL